MTKIATWNVNSGFIENHGDYTYDKNNFESYVQSVLSGIEIDIILFQEFPISKIDGEESLRSFFAKTSLPFVAYGDFSDSHLDTELRLGVVIASRNDITSSEAHLLPTPEIDIVTPSRERQASHTKGAVSATIKTEQGELNVVNIHLPPFKNLDRDPGEPIFNDLRDKLFDLLANPNQVDVLGGDFNCSSPSDFDKRYSVELHLSETVKGCTRKDGRQTDNLLISDSLLLRSSMAMSTLSDHHLCLAELYIREEPSDSVSHLAKERFTRILHLTDMHLGPGEADDVDWKSFITDAERETRSRRLEALICALQPRPDFVVVSGDSTIANRREGLDQASELFKRLIQRGVFPSRERIGVVPGNHDVQRRSFNVTLSDKDRWRNFQETLGKNFAKPFFAFEREDSDILNCVESQIRSGKKLIGGVTGSIDSSTGETLHESYPFIMDLEKRTLIYLFNSASVSGSEVILSDETESKLIEIHKLLSRQADGEFLSAFEELLSMKYVDAARVNPSEIYLFRSLMDIFRERIKDYSSSFTKIAVLHHHISTIYGEEVKSFDITTNAGRLKKELCSEKFDIVLHGHKHWPEAFIDSAITDGGAINVVSGSTVGGTPERGSAGFGVIDISADGIEAKVHFVPLSDRNPSTILKESLSAPERTFSLGNEGRQASVLDPHIIQTALDRARHALSSNLRRAQPSTVTERGDRWGWNNFFDRPGISVLGTSFSLSALTTIGALPSNVFARRQGIGNYLLANRRTNGGWSASSAGEPGQPLETAFVLRALAHCISPEAFEEELNWYESFLDSFEGLELSATYTKATILNIFSDFRPSSNWVNRLGEGLLSGRRAMNDARIWGWAAQSSFEALQVWSDAEFSLAHSAMAANALHAAYNATAGEFGEKFEPDDELIRWILSADWPPISESIPQAEGKRSIINLSADCICLTLLSQVGFSRSDVRIAERIDRLVSRQVSGVWAADGQRPTGWATLDGVAALKSYA